MNVTGSRSGSDLLIEVEGLDKVFRALRGVDNEAGKEINRLLKDGAKDVAREAAALSSSTISGLSYIRSGYKVKAGKKAGRKTRSSLFGWVVENLGTGGNGGVAGRPGAGAAIAEFAGSRSRGLTPQGRGLIAALEARSGDTGRYAWRAFDHQKADLEGRMRFAMRNVERILQVGVD